MDEPDLHALHAPVVHHGPAADFPSRDRRPPAQRSKARRCSPRYAQRRSRPAARQCLGEFVLEGAALPDLGSRRSQRDVRERRRVHHFRPHEESFCPDGFAYRCLSRFARRYRALHLHHAQTARRHVCRSAGQAVPWIDGDTLLCRRHIRHRRLCAVDAEAGFRRLSRPPPARRALARHPQSGRHPACHVDARGRLHRRNQYLGRSRFEGVAVRAAGRDDGAIPRSPAAHEL